MSHAARRLLWPASWLYGGVVAARNALFGAGVRRVHRLSVPVVSVGNLTVGGTGKTPLVLWLAERAIARGRAPGVLARGYGRAPGAALNDEGMLIARRLPGLPQVQDPDRVRGGRALQQQGVDLVILDDGFQHRRLHRDRDLVCLDASAPFDNGMLLPAGDLREPRRGLRRADAVVLTRAHHLDAAAFERRSRELRALARRQLAVFAATHEPRDIVAMPGGETLPPSALRRRRVGLLSAIARPGSFARTAQALGAEVVWTRARRDHHRFAPAEVAAAAARAAADDAVLLVTEKDEVKIEGCSEARWVLRIDLRFVDDEPGDEVLGLATGR